MNRKQRIFVDQYLRCWNATQAAKDAGYSQRTAGVQGHRLLQRDDVQALISERIEDVAMGADEVLIRLAEQARADMADIVTLNKQGELQIDLEALKAKGLSRLIKTLRQSKRDGLVVELYDAQSALVHLGRAHGVFVDKTALTDPTGQEQYDGFADIKDQLERRLNRLAAAVSEESVPGEPDA